MLRHIAAGLATLSLSLQIVFLGGGLSCITPNQSGSEMASMAQMDMGGERPAPAIDTIGEGHEDCSVPWMPAACQVMAPCAPSAVETSAVSVLPLPSLSDEMARLIVLAPPSRSSPPELPPPRA